VSVLENLKFIRENVQKACAKSRRPQSAITIIGVSKLQPIELVREGVETARLKDLGENYVQDLTERLEIFPDVRWHLIGPLQTNKAKSVVGKVALIHTIDRLSLIEVVARLAVERNTIQEILLQINIAGEESKSGVSPEGAAKLIREIKSKPSLKLRGLMTMPPYVENSELSRTHFKNLCALMNRLNKEMEVNMDVLSMGTSQDYDVAVEEGATHIRVGTILFKERTLAKRESK
jgi:pyridoxal phosphate enzyme (YggS family)